VVKYEFVAVGIDPSYEEPLLTQPQPKKSALVSYNHYKYLSLALVAS